jgi:hypothetical protein
VDYRSSPKSDLNRSHRRPPFGDPLRLVKCPLAHLILLNHVISWRSSNTRSMHSFVTTITALLQSTGCEMRTIFENGSGTAD